MTDQIERWLRPGSIVPVEPETIVTLIAEVVKLRTALLDCATDLQASVTAEYAGVLDYPVMRRKFERDMEPVARAKTVLGSMWHEPPLTVSAQKLHCAVCDGAGVIAHRVTVYEHGCGFPHDDTDERPCSDCKGSGRPICPRCGERPIDPIFLGADGEGRICGDCWAEDRHASDEQHWLAEQPSATESSGK